jgi:pimeloyl-ACP methyl ester carboxylesterase
MRNITLSLLLVIGFHAVANASPCTLAYPADAIEYWTKTNPVANSTRCDWNGSTPSCHWYGWLWKGPAANSPSTGNLPLVIYIHGSGQAKGRSSICEIVNYLVPKGYAVFMPYMRGVDDTSSNGTGAGFKNTGVYIEDYAAQGGASGNQLVLNTLSYMEWEAADEVQFALDKVTALNSGDGSKKLINPNKIALWGHSYGGAVVNIATGTTLSPQPAATIDIGGAVMSWPNNSNWELVLDSYASQAKNAIYFQQVLNESSASPYSIESTSSPFRQATAAGGAGAEMAVFGSIAPDADTQANCNANGTPQYQCVHNAFIQDHNSVTHWIGTAVEFMSRHGVK